MNGTTNLKELAKILGVSISTVSKSLRDSYEIGEGTRKRVKEMAEKMGYNRNPYAGHLRNHKSNTIAVVIPEITNNFFIQIIKGAETISQQKDYHILIYVSNDNYEQEASILKHLHNGRVDGVIMSLASNTKTYDHINDLIQVNIPVVFFDRICHEIETAKITTNDFVSGFNATEHLIQQGCRDIAYLSISQVLSIDNKRKQGYLEALSKYDIPFNPKRIIYCGNNAADNLKKIKALLKQKVKPDGIFAAVEKLAISSYEVCNSLRIKIPDEIKIICFSNLDTASLLNPSLTTITQPAFEIGKQAATVLFKNLDKNKRFIPNENIVLKSKLFTRESTTVRN